MTSNDAGTRVGWIGLGAMGAPMAACVARAGHDTRAYDIDPTRAQALAADGTPHHQSGPAPTLSWTELDRQRTSTRCRNRPRLRCQHARVPGYGRGPT